MSALACIDWQLPGCSADARRGASVVGSLRDGPNGDLRLGLAAALTGWLVALAPLFA